MSAAVSRRGFLSALTRSFKEKAPATPRPLEPPAAADTAPRTAIIQGRFCLALTSFCSVCSERCPVPGAIHRERGLPMISADVCTGCGICQDVCPAPRNALLMMPRRNSAPAEIAP